ncbi:uncharacterized protein LOC121970661 [Zingiber officinale]|uniref:uncharacterized protein LOC121970661 n=1 Tax=Zingiber officinale TaxID=94328 RepID=UPI001C4BC398|nr:uncharacterized protein LOC121970661 [Zingiber officinale]
MEKYAVSAERLRKPRFRPRWTHMIPEIEGRIPLSYRREASALFHNSLGEVRIFGHDYLFEPESCATFLAHMADPAYPSGSFLRQGISGLEFDNKGIYLASVTKSGCLTVHDFETLYCAIYGPTPSQLVNEAKDLVHISKDHELDSIRWNPNDQHEVVCASRQNNNILLFDITYISPDPVQVLCCKRHTNELSNGLSDVLFDSANKSRLFASCLDGNVYVLDTRSSNSQCLMLTTDPRREINSIALYLQDRVVLGAGKRGLIHSWDLRGGRQSHAFQSHNQSSIYPLLSIKVSAELEKISSLKAQTHIVPKEIHSININPSCSDQLAFHMVDGWSGVLDLRNVVVTHVHCPPADLDGTDISTHSIMRRPAWLPTSSIYTVGSVSDKGLYLLDFFPRKDSACHVDFNPEARSNSQECSRILENKHIPVSQNILVCAVHPLNNTIIAGTKQSCLMMISPKHKADNGD